MDDLPEGTFGDLAIACRALEPERGEGVLVLAGGHDGVTDSDPFFRDRYPIMRPRAVVVEAIPTAHAAEEWSRAALRVLAAHPVNAARRRGGRRALHEVTLKWWGRARPATTFAARHGLDGVLVGGSAFLAGLATTMGMRFIAAAEDPDPATALGHRLTLARAAFDGGATFVFCHLKAPDEAGHSKDPVTKRNTIAAIDGALADLDARFAREIVCVTGDHATPTSPEVIHSGDPVPFLVAGPGVRSDRVVAFGELDYAQGILGHLTGADVMPVLLNAADRPLFLGSRPTPTPFAAGAPSDVEPLAP
jgi:2,3-bisphosphoglycerate-independent phosphoglycerate mutase